MIDKILRELLYKPFGRKLMPYDYIQAHVEDFLADITGASTNCVNIVIVGAYNAKEVKKLRGNFSEPRFILYEPSSRIFSKLESKFNTDKSVTLRNVAVSNVAGLIQFYEGSLKGTGSILKIGETAKEFYDLKPAESYQVEATTLDSDLPQLIQQEELELLWIDVQGAEMSVLEGARNTLNKTKAVFAEVSLQKPIYVDGCLYADLDEYLSQFGFVISGLGLDPYNGTGNALWTKRFR